MVYPVLKGAGYALINTPDMIMQNGTTQTTEKIVNPGSEYLKALPEHIRSYDQVVNYAPNQVYIGNMRPESLRSYGMPWHDKGAENATRFGKFGEIMPQDEFILLMKMADAFELVMIEKDFMEQAREKLSGHPLFKDEAAALPGGVEISEIEAALEQHAEAVYHGGNLVGCVKKAHDVDTNLSAHVLFENIVAKASGTLAFKHLIDKNGIDVRDVQYVIECSEEACGDMNQRGGGNFAKSIAEKCGAVNATGSDTRGFCAAPVHALIQAAALVQSGVYENVVVVAGGATAKLGMNGKDHVKKGLPVLEDVLGAFAVMVSKNDGESPIIRTDLTGRHTVGTGSSPQAVITSLVTAPLDRSGMKVTDIDKFSVEMQNPDITKPAGAGDVPEANYKMIAALSVKRQELERSQLPEFIVKHGMPGWAPTQGHIPSGVPYLGFAKEDLTCGDLNKVMIVGKGSLFLGRMTDLFDGVSVVIERNPGEASEEAGALQVESSGASQPGQPAKVRIGLTTLGSEHGIENLVAGAELAAKDNSGFEIVLIGPKTGTELEVAVADTEKEMYRKMEELLDKNSIQACVTMHYDFPIGVSTVGKVVTPGAGKEMLLATTTGTASTQRVEAMVKNALHGIIAAKATGIKSPTVGILNLDGARQAERALKELAAGGYEINFAESGRADGGAVMRGNDLLQGTADVMVTDTLTGNIMMKVFSAYTTGGSYEATGYGYGPGIGENYGRAILILSRASGAPVVANAIRYAAKLAQGNLAGVAKKEFADARKAGLDGILKSVTKDAGKAKEGSSGEASPPPKEVVTGEISGIDIMILEDAVQELWKNGIYAESGMGCTGPIVRVAEDKVMAAAEILTREKYINAE
ncbi:MAG: glycine/sarcosine/betaine reductase complex component C subunit beta [Clostridiales bacterium]|nr:glycine/sarcosine/betaine reductase complex component C subunit beta [Clostridiales bacterium]